MTSLLLVIGKVHRGETGALVTRGIVDGVLVLEGAVLGRLVPAAVQTQAGRYIVGVDGLDDGFEAPFAGARHEHFKDAAKINADGSVFYENGCDIDIEAEELAVRRRHPAPPPGATTGSRIAFHRVLGHLGDGINFATSPYEALDFSPCRRLKGDEMGDERRSFAATAWPL